MSPIYLGPAHDVRGVEVLVCVSCDVYIVLWNGLGRSVKFLPPVVFSGRNGNSPFRFCLLTAPSPHLPLPWLLGKPDALRLPLGHSPLLLGACPFRGSGGCPPRGLPSPHSVGKEGGGRGPRLLRAQAIRLLPPFRG